MKNKISYVVTLIILMFCSLDARCQPSQSQIDELTQRYQKAKSGREKRDIVIDAIDKKCIAQYVSIEVVKRICGSDFEIEIQKADKSGAGRVYFESFIKGKNGASDYYTGWFMEVHFGPHRKIGHYDLSNVWKGVKYVE